MSRRADDQGPVQGTVAPGFESVRDLYENETRTMAEENTQLCVYVRDERVVDLWRSAAGDARFSADSLVNVFSSGKSLETIAIASLVGRGLLRYDDKIADHWPEFGTHDWNDWRLFSDNGHRIHDAEYVNAVDARILLPRVIQLRHFDRVPRSRVKLTRANIYLRDRYRCQYCGQKRDTGELSVDHITPRSRGGVSSWSNCVLACLECNRRKANRTLQEAGMGLVHSPKEPTWSPTLHIPMARRKVSWQSFISDQYWNVELDA